MDNHFHFSMCFICLRQKPCANAEISLSISLPNSLLRSGLLNSFLAVFRGGVPIGVNFVILGFYLSSST